MPAATHSNTQHQAEHARAAKERWIEGELTGDSRLTVLRILYNDIRDYGNVKDETWDYFELQEITGGAESMDTHHITLLKGEYDPMTDEIVAAVAGGERVTYDKFTVDGLQRAMERAAQNPNFAFQIPRDQIYFNNFHGPVKDMWRGRTNYDTVFYVSTFPQDIIDALGEQGRMIVKDLAYDDKAKKGFIYGFRKCPDNTMDFFAVRMANATPEYTKNYLQKRGFRPEQFEGIDSHRYGEFVMTATTAGHDFKEVAKQEVGAFDQAAAELTGKSHSYGREKSGPDAYDIFKHAPKLRAAYREYHRLLAEHFTGVPLSNDLYDYLVNTKAAVGAHVLEDYENERLEAYLAKGTIEADMALACKKIMTYAHYAKLNELLEEYHATGQIADIVGDDLMQAYGAAAGDSGGAAAERGEVFNDCDLTYGQTATTAAIEMAANQGISLEEAMRRLARKPERWSRGNCRNCERETYVWKEEHGGCNVCRKCANEHTVYGQRGLDNERRRAQVEREAVRRRAVAGTKDTMPEKKSRNEGPSGGVSRYVNQQRLIQVRQVTLGGARNVWVDATTRKTVDVAPD